MSDSKVIDPEIRSLEPQSLLEPDAPYQLLIFQFESLIIPFESNPQMTLPETFADDLRQIFNQLKQLAPFKRPSPYIQFRKLAYRIWYPCLSIPFGNELCAKVLRICCDLYVFSYNDVVLLSYEACRCAFFYHHTGIRCYDLKQFDDAATCYKIAADFVSKLDVSKIVDPGEKNLLFFLNLHRARLAWDLSDRDVAITLLNGTKSLVFGLPRHYAALGQEYVVFAESFVRNGETNCFNQALELANEALDLYEKAFGLVRTPELTVVLEDLRWMTLMVKVDLHLQMAEYGSAMDCVQVLREVNYKEVEKDLREVEVNKGIGKRGWLAAVKAYFEGVEAAGHETAKGVFLGLLERAKQEKEKDSKQKNHTKGNGAQPKRQKKK